SNSQTAVGASPVDREAAARAAQARIAKSTHSKTGAAAAKNNTVNRGNVNNIGIGIGNDNGKAAAAAAAATTTTTTTTSSSSSKGKLAQQLEAEKKKSNLQILSEASQAERDSRRADTNEELRRWD
ncbi:hypothetical protein KEM54_006113, partial [Ascosphaera aggregata]